MEILGMILLILMSLGTSNADDLEQGKEWVLGGLFMCVELWISWTDDFLIVTTCVREKSIFTEFIGIITRIRKNLIKPHLLPYNKLESLNGEIIPVRLQG